MKKALYGTLMAATFASALYIGGPFGCSSTNSGADGGGNTTTTTIDNALAVTYPAGLAVTSIVAEGTSSTAALRLKNVAEDADSVDIPTYQEAQEQQVSMLNADTADDCNVFESFRQKLTADCYGHGFTVIDHGTPQSVLLGDGGIEASADADGTACIAAKFNALNSEFIQYVELAQNMNAFIRCAAKVQDTDVDAATEVGGSVDLAAASNETMDAIDGPVDIDTALVERTDDGSTDTAEYHTAIEGSISLGDAASGDASATISLETFHEEATADAETSALTLKRSVNIDDTTYSGVINLKFSLDLPDGVTSDVFAVPGDCGASGMTECIAISYQKIEDETSLAESATGGYVLRTLVERGQFCGATDEVNCFTAEGRLNREPAAGGGGGGGGLVVKNVAEELTGWKQDFNYSVCNLVNQTIDSNVVVTGQCAHAWQAGANDGNTRAMVVKVNLDDDNKRTGCGYVGFGPAANSNDVGTLLGMCTKWSLGGDNALGTDPELRFVDDGPCVQRVQQECFSENDSGQLIVDETVGDLLIEYAPTLTANKLSTDQISFTTSALDGGWSSAADANFTTNMPLLSTLLASEEIPTLTEPIVTATVE